MEITGSSWKLGFQWNFRLENTFSRSWITFFPSSFAYSSVIKPITPEVKKMFPKRLLIRKPNFYTKYIFPNKTKNLNPFPTDISTRFHALRTLWGGPAKYRETMKPVRLLVSNKLHHPWI